MEPGSDNIAPEAGAGLNAESLDPKTFLEGGVLG